MECYLTCLNNSHGEILLPDRVPVVVGRMPELGITDKVCSRNQLELTSNYHSKYVLVKRLGSNPSQIDGIEIERNTTSKLISGQKLFIVNMKYPHCVKFKDSCDQGIHEERDSSHHVKDSFPPSKRTKSYNKTDAAKKKLKIKNATTNNHDCLEDESSSEYSFKSNEDNVQSGVKISLAETTKTDKKSATTSKHWSSGLKSAMEDPENQVFQDEEVIIIKDKYPKARFHWLVLPRKNIPSIKHLKQEHLKLIKHMLEVGQALVNKKTDDSSLTSIKFRYGFHAIASMSQLHLHVISQDFSSKFLKTKKHWNSFTTDYFVDANDIIAELKTNGEVKNRSSSRLFLDTGLRCHICSQSQKNMPTLKRHIESCK